MILATSTRNSQADGLAALADAGSAGAKLKLRTGATPGAGTLLVTFTLSTTGFGAASSGVITAASMPKTATAAATGTAGNYELTDSDDNVIANGASVAAGSGEVNLISTSITNGQTCTLSSMTITVPAGT